MNKKSCILWPQVNGKASKLYKELLNRNKIPRPLVNLIYASYISSDMADKMDNAGYKRNEQGQHQSTDVLNFIDYARMQNEFGNMAQEELQLGSIDSNGNRVDYTNAKDALEKVDKFNDSHTGVVATVVQHGNVFNIIVNQKNSKTLDYADDVKQRLKAWEINKQFFSAKGIDIENMPAELSDVFNAYNYQMYNNLLNLKYTRLQDLDRKSALLLFSVNANLPQVKRLVGKFGSLENAAQFVEDVNAGIKRPSSSESTLIGNAFVEAKKFKGLDFDALKTQIDQSIGNIKSNSPDESVRNTLHKLNKKYKIGINEIHKINGKIKSLSDAATEALFVLERKVRELQKQVGNNAEGKALSITVNQLLNEINSKRYYSGVIKFLGEASKEIATVDNFIKAAQQTGTDLEQIFSKAKALQKIDDIRTKYYDLVSALANENLTIDESISKVDIDNIRSTAKTLRDYFDKKAGVIDDLANGVMESLMTQIVGTTAPDGQAMINAVQMAAADTSSMDYLYSIARSSNVMIGAMGSVIRNAQDNRNGAMNDIYKRIKRATNRLYKSNSSSEFMYEDDGHIISDIDWQAYKDARKAKIKELYKKGLRDFDLKQEIENWEENNTEDRVVDKVSGRTERVPNQNYRKQFPQLTQEQQEYYDTMMQIKGEIGTLLPAYAQKQYLPPQIRRSMLDALGHAKSVSDVAKAFRNKIQNIYTVREDDENWNMNGIIDGDEYNITEGSFDNTPLKQIPIFFIKPLKDGDELLKNFSSGLEALAGTAINYDAMNSVADVVEFMGNFAKQQMARNDTRQADVVEGAQVRVVKDLKKLGNNTNTGKIIDGFIQQYVYGKYRDNSGGYLLNKLIDSLISYTSFKGLATNVKGAFANYIMGEFQMMIEAGAGEFYGFKDFAWAHAKLFGSAGVTGEMWDLLNETRNSKGRLFADLFDPEQENFDSKSHEKFHKSAFRKLMAHDLSFVGYGSGEYLIHYVNMYSVLHRQKVKLNGKIIPLFDAFEVTEQQDGVANLKLKDGVTRLDGSAITHDFIDQVRRKIKYVNQTCHGAMNKEDKGLIYQKWWGRLAMNFRQWMVEHYSRRFRGMHFDASLGENREGYWVSAYKLFENDESREVREEGERIKALGLWLKDLVTFNWRCRTNWANMNDMQRYNCRRAMTESLMLIALSGLSFALGEPDEHKKDVWRRWWIYQTRRMIMDTEASMPNPYMLNQIVTIMQSPFGAVSTMTGLLYVFFGLMNGDITETIKSGVNKGDNKYFRNILRYTLPVFKDIEQMQNMDTDDSIFQVFNVSPSGR